MMKVGVISDTHGLLRQEVLEILRSCDCILHAGDINNQGIVDELGRIAPVYAVRGNNDKEWAEHLPHDLTVHLESLKIFMVHNKKEIQNLPLDADMLDIYPILIICVLCGWNSQTLLLYLLSPIRILFPQLRHP